MSYFFCSFLPKSPPPPDDSISLNIYPWDKARLAAPVKEDVSRPPPEFVIKSHPRRTNLVAIVTQEEEVARNEIVIF